MQKIVLLFFSVLFGVSGVLAEEISGRVVDEQNRPLQLVNVSLPAEHRGAVTDEDGRFVIQGLRLGVYILEFSLVGYKKETRIVTVDDDVEIAVTLYVTSIEVPGVIVTATPQPTDALSSSQSVTAIEGKELLRLRGESIMQTIANTPGVSTYSTGSGIAKPVIRGLTSQRVLIVADGTRQEGQQWGDEHGPEIDAFDVERVEVVRGPSSVLYGSDALGGVVNIIKHELPDADKGAPKLGGELALNGFTNNDQMAGSFSLFGTGGPIGYRGYISSRKSGDVTTPAGTLFNSGIEELNGGGQLGAEGPWGHFSIDYSRFHQETQIHEDPAEDPTATPFLRTEHEKVHLHGDFPTSVLRFELDGSWQQNNRREFEEKNAPAEALHLKLSTLSLDIKGHHSPIGNIFGTIGFSLMSQKNESLAEEKLIPGYDFLNLAGFLYEEMIIGNFNLSLGVRYDTREVNVEAESDLGVAEQTLNYGALSGTIGGVLRLSEQSSLSANVGRGWRAPTPFELFVDGVHEGTVQYLVGDNALSTESSLNIDLSYRYITNRMQAEVTVFRNAINKYIYISPTGTFDLVSGYEIYLIKQADATLIGTEISLQAQVANWLVLKGGFDYVQGENETTGKPLPLVPASRFKAGARLLTSEMGPILDPYFSIDVRAVMKQDRIEDYELPTGGYTLVDIGFGGALALGSKRISLDAGVENLLDTEYRSHLSRYKAYALNAGRNITLKVGIPFDIVN
ncbi:MAG: TonB-dependent receptor [Ignavibacteriae bacterium]|nr:TonB-dependent receptor [Ignavibacteriota bacterium]